MNLWSFNRTPLRPHTLESSLPKWFLLLRWWHVLLESSLSSQRLDPRRKRAAIAIQKSMCSFFFVSSGVGKEGQGRSWGLNRQDQGSISEVEASLSLSKGLYWPLWDKLWSFHQAWNRIREFQMCDALEFWLGPWLYKMLEKYQSWSILSMRICVIWNQSSDQHELHSSKPNTRWMIACYRSQICHTRLNAFEQHHLSDV